MSARLPSGEHLCPDLGEGLRRMFDPGDVDPANDRFRRLAEALEQALQGDRSLDSAPRCAGRRPA